jgi:hypothetical protein
MAKIDNHQLAVETLRAVMLDPAAPAASKAQAARTLLELDGHLGRYQPPPSAGDARDLAGMSRAELLAELAAMRPTPTPGGG